MHSQVLVKRKIGESDDDSGVEDLRAESSGVSRDPARGEAEAAHGGEEDGRPPATTKKTVTCPREEPGGENVDTGDGHL